MGCLSSDTKDTIHEFVLVCVSGHETQKTHPPIYRGCFVSAELCPVLKLIFWSEGQ
jgi:hypothetical protein